MVEICKSKISFLCLLVDGSVGIILLYYLSMYNGVRVLVLLCKKEADLSAEGSRNISLFVSMMRMFAEEGPPMNMDEHSEHCHRQSPSSPSSQTLHL
jgi:hypothetical protein